MKPEKPAGVVNSPFHFSRAGVVAEPAFIAFDDEVEVGWRSGVALFQGAFTIMLIVAGRSRETEVMI